MSAEKSLYDTLYEKGKEALKGLKKKANSNIFIVTDLKFTDNYADTNSRMPANPPGIPQVRAIVHRKS